MGPPVKVNVPRRLLDGFSALKKKEKAFLEEFLTRDGSVQPLLDKLREVPTPDTGEGKDAKIRELENIIKGNQRQMAALSARIEQLETNGCALITSMVSNQLAVNRRYKQMFNFEEDSPPRPQGAAGSSASLAGSSSDGQFFAHPLDPNFRIPTSWCPAPSSVGRWNTLLGATSTAEPRKKSICFQKTCALPQLLT